MGSQGLGPSSGRAPSGHLDVIRHWQMWHSLGLVMDTGTPEPWGDPGERAPLGRGRSSISLSSKPLQHSTADLAVRGLRTQHQPQEHRLLQPCRSTARHQQAGFRHSRGD